MYQPSADEADPFGEADESHAAAGIAGGDGRAIVAQIDGQAVPGRTGQAHRHLGARRVPMGRW